MLTRQMRVRELLALIVTAGAILLTGCSTNADGFRPATGCWIPGSGSSSCGGLASVDGQTPVGQLVDMTGVYRLSSPGLTDDGLTMVWANTDNSCVARSFSVPMFVDGSIWRPDLTRMSGPAIGCIAYDGPDYSWVMDMFSGPVRVTMLDSQMVRIAVDGSGSAEYVDFRWAD